MTALDVVVGRQPIFDHNMTIFAYELLFRPVDADSAGDSTVQGDRMTAEVLFSSINIGVDRLVSDKKLFCEASRGVLLGEVPLMLPPDRTVIEIVESVVLDEQVLAGCRRLREEGYELALDDFLPPEETEEVLEIAQMVKIDIERTQESEIPSLMQRCRAFGIRTIAENVATLDEFNRCTELGFDYFQGYLLAKPRHVNGKALDVGRLAKLRMSSQLVDSECPVSKLEQIIKSDPAMTHQLLQLAGIGAARGMRRNVKTINEALVILGWRRLQSWVALLLIADKGRGSQEGITNALIRARMCELMAKDIDPSASDEAFTVGMVSSFDLLLGMPLEEVLESLPLADDIRDALLNGSGTLGPLVADVCDYLTGHHETATRCGLPEQAFSNMALRALLWAVELSSVLDVTGATPKEPALSH